MITGETEAIIDAHVYDDFFSRNRKKRSTRKRARKKKRFIKKTNRFKKRSSRRKHSLRKKISKGVIKPARMRGASSGRRNTYQRSAAKQTKLSSLKRPIVSPISSRKRNRLDRKIARKSARSEKRLIKKSSRIEKRALKRTNPVRLARGKRRKEFLSGLGSILPIKELGEKTGLFTGATSASNEVASDYEISMGGPVNSGDKKSGIPTAVYIAGGIAVAALIGVIVMKVKKTTPTSINYK